MNTTERVARIFTGLLMSSVLVGLTSPCWMGASMAVSFTGFWAEGYSGHALYVFGYRLPLVLAVVSATGVTIPIVGVFMGMAMDVEINKEDET